MILVHKDEWFYCKDEKLRDFFLFGTYRSCIKIYKRLSAAIKVAKRIGGKVIKIPEGISMDSSGSLFERKPAPNKPDYEVVVPRKLSEFEVDIPA